MYHLVPHQGGETLLHRLPSLLSKILFAQGKEVVELVIRTQVGRSQHATQSLHFVQGGDIHVLPFLVLVGLFQTVSLVRGTVAAALGLGGAARGGLAVIGVTHRLQRLLRGLQRKLCQGTAERNLRRNMCHDVRQLLAHLQ